MSILKIVLCYSMHTLDGDTNHVYLDLFYITKLYYFIFLSSDKFIQKKLVNYVQFRMGKTRENKTARRTLNNIIITHKIDQYILYLSLEI